MKEKRFTIKSVMKKLEKDGFVKVEPLCIDCVIDLECLVMNNFVDAVFKLDCLGDKLYSLTIIL